MESLLTKTTANKIVNAMFTSNGTTNATCGKPIDVRKFLKDMEEAKKLMGPPIGFIKCDCNLCGKPQVTQIGCDTFTVSKCCLRGFIGLIGFKTIMEYLRPLGLKLPESVNVSRSFLKHRCEVMENKTITDLHRVARIIYG